MKAGTWRFFCLLAVAQVGGVVTARPIQDAHSVCFSFNVIGRLADAFGFFVPGSQAFEAGAKYLLARGYR